jgi:hypothetical protein
MEYMRLQVYTYCYASVYTGIEMYIWTYQSPIYIYMYIWTYQYSTVTAAIAAFART